MAARSLLRTRPGLLFALLTFLLPTTVVYSFSMYNIGLILRQRMPVVLVGMLLASLSWTDEMATVPSESEGDPEPDDDDREAHDEDDDVVEAHVETG